jgi:hypothetical protein
VTILAFAVNGLTDRPEPHELGWRWLLTNALVLLTLSLLLSINRA